MVVHLNMKFHGSGPARVLLLYLVIAALSACNSSSDGTPADPPLQSGLRTFESAGVEREYYLQLPSDYPAAAADAAALAGDAGSKPLVIAFHGYTGSLDNWVADDRIYDLIDVVGDEAVMVFPNALRDANGDRSWNSESDLPFFQDLLAELDLLGLQYDPARIFVAGHSNGAGFVHELTCEFGDIVRATAAAAGALSSTECVGSAAMLMFQGNNDPLVDINIAQGTLRYWVLYNGWDLDASVPSDLNQACSDYGFPGELNSPYPTLWCEHTQGHDWPDFASATAWAFFSGLPAAEPTIEAPAGGGSERATPPQDTTLTFRLQVPAEINRPLNGAASLFPRSFADEPFCTAPEVFLNNTFSVDGLLTPGEVTEEITIPITYFAFNEIPFPSEWALQITIYVEGGSRPIPVEGVDQKVVTPLTVSDRTTPVIIPDVLVLEPSEDLCGF